METGRPIPVAWTLFTGSADMAGNREVSMPWAQSPSSSTIHNQPPQWRRKWSQELTQQWCDRSSNCERPRTYDKFYAKTPANFFATPPSASSAAPISSSASSSSSTRHTSSGPTMTTDSAISMCSSEEEAKVISPSHRRVKRRSKAQRELQYSRTLTERDVRHLERHLSMKKTIRKKIMRDLQQAFVENPLEFASPGKRDLDLKALNFDAKSRRHSKSEQRFLDLLRDSSDDSGLGSPKAEKKFRSVRERPKPRYSFVDSLSDDNNDPDLDRFERQIRDNLVISQQHQQQSQLYLHKNQEEKTKKTKKSFWNLIFGGKKSKDKKTSSQ